MGRILLITTTSLTFYVVTPALGTMWHVAPPPLESDSNAGTQEKPFATIQKGVNAASDGDTVIVAEGTYFENIEFNGKNIVLRSTDAQNPAVVAATIINGNPAGSVVTFEGTENDTCLLSGFTIRNGGLRSDGGGIFGNGTHATISENTITGNVGGGLSYCDGTVQNNVTTGNSAWSGGGLYDCRGTIRNWIISRNTPRDGSQVYNPAGEPSPSITYCWIEGWGGQHCPGPTLP